MDGCGTDPRCVRKGACMPEMTRAVLLSGRPLLPPEPLELHAGPLSVRYENGSIRHVRLGDVEVVRRVYPALRDPNWGTVEPVIHDETIEDNPGSFQIHYRADYRQADIHFTARYSISGSAAGIRFAMAGRAITSFKANRIGFCILHPVEECAGKACVVTHPDGSATGGAFPLTISPHQPFKNIRSMKWQPAAGLEAEVVYGGDVFEMEDQRNWTDASYKTYCTPLERPFPVRVAAGHRIEQTVDLYVKGSARYASGSGPALRLANGSARFPRLGLAASHDKKALDAASVTLLKQLGLHHYRFDLHPADSNWLSEAGREFANAAALSVKAEVALHIHPDHWEAFTACVGQLKKFAPAISCLTVLNAARKTTDGELLSRAVPVLRSALPAASIGAGTDCFFAELNRERTPADLIDFLSFSVNPQVHAFDDLSLVETMQAHRYLVESARQFAGGKAVHVSPVTLKRRFNPDATGPEAAAAPGGLPAAVDPRQMSLFGAAWALGCIKYLAESGAESITCFETVGWRGVMQGDGDSPLPDRFPASKGQVFPVWQVLKWLLEYQDGEIVPIASSHPLLVDGLMLRMNGRRRLIAANYSLKTRTLPLHETPERVTFLDESTAAAFHQRPGSLPAQECHRPQVLLMPYGLACMDFRGPVPADGFV